MAIPTITDKNQGLTLLTNDIGAAESAWTAYADVVTADYSWAWEHQGPILKEVHDNIHARLEAEEKTAVFLLNLVTVGIGSEFAGDCVKKIIGSSEAKDIVDGIAKLATSQSANVIKGGDDWVVKHFGSEPSEDPFRPPGLSPTRYGATLAFGIHNRATVLKNALSEVLKRPNVTLQGVQKLAEKIYSSTFMQQPPQVKPGDLQKPALLGLWLAWALDRDVDYWAFRSGDMINYPKYAAEAVDFEPVRKDLRIIGVPIRQMSHFAMIVGEQHTDDNKVIDMYAFIKWARSMDAVNLLFRGTKVPTEMQRRIQIQLMVKSMMPKPFRAAAEAATW
jgi:hypothetical protein